MKKVTRFESFLTSWKFFVLLVVLQFMVLPVATRNFQFEASGQIIFATLGRAWINELYPYSTAFQLVALLMIGALLYFRKRAARWFPVDLQTAQPDLHPVHLFTGISAMAFCPMTPVFLAILSLSRPNINMTTYRVTAMIGLIIGCYNMGQFAAPNGFYLGIYHLPLLLVSLYALLSSKRIK